MEKNIGCSKI
jgi:TolA-binding protein